MAFPLALTSVLTGATPSQLHRWAHKGLVVPEVQRNRPPLYSFRDLIALRSMVKLRSEVSLQKISKAFANLDIYDLTEHPASYRFATDGDTIWVEEPGGDGRALDLVKAPGQATVLSFADVFAPFNNFHDQAVVAFTQPAAHVTVRPRRLGGWPTIENTRIGYDTIANLVDGDSITVDDVPEYYPDVSVEAAKSAIELDNRVRALRAA